MPGAAKRDGGDALRDGATTGRGFTGLQIPAAGGEFDGLYRSAQNSMKRDAVRLNLPQRQRAVEEIVGSFAKWQIENAALK